MLLLLLLLVPLIGIFIISTIRYDNDSSLSLKQIKTIGLSTSVLNLFILTLFIYNFITY